MKCKRKQFNLPKDATYLNGAYMSPLLKSVEKVGIKALKLKNNPAQITADDFFDPVNSSRKAVAKLINAKKWERIAIIPSVSYGIANAAYNIDYKKNDEILMVGEQFPSNYYVWRTVGVHTGCKLRVIAAPDTNISRGEKWNSQILSSINSKTKVIAMPMVHWADGTVFDLLKIRKAANKNGALLIIDGTQSVGALPFDVKKIKPDALVCGAYKWLMGPYSTGFAYYGKYFAKGAPMEESWMIRKGSENFSSLVNYQEDYRKGAIRYDVGQTANFNLLPMMHQGVQKLLKWKPENIQAYTRKISTDVLEDLKEEGYWIEDEAYRSSHLFGIRPPFGTNTKKLKKRLVKNKISVSFRSDSIRVSPGVYNSKKDMERLKKVLLG